jgi:hypothetical protein
MLICFGELSVDELTLRLLARLEAVADRDQSVYDTAVRDALIDPIFYLFLKPTPGYELPAEYGVSESADAQIRHAIDEFIQEAMKVSPSIGLDTFHKRLAAFQDERLTTGRNTVEDFFGWCDPAAFDETGELINS